MSLFFCGWWAFPLSFSQTLLWPGQPPPAPVLHTLLHFQDDGIQAYGFKHPAWAEDLLPVPVQASLHVRTQPLASRSQEHGVHTILLTISLPANPPETQLPQTSLSDSPPKSTLTKFSRFTLPEPPQLYPRCYCFGSRTTHPTLMHGLLMDLWACPQFILHTKTRMAPRHTSGDVIFLLKVLQSLSHNLQDQAQTPQRAQQSFTFFTLLISRGPPPWHASSCLRAFEHTVSSAWTAVPNPLRAFLSPSSCLHFLLTPISFSKCNSVSGNPLIHPCWLTWSSSRPLMPLGPPSALSLLGTARWAAWGLQASSTRCWAPSGEHRMGAAWHGQCIPLVSFNEEMKACRNEWFRKKKMRSNFSWNKILIHLGSWTPWINDKLFSSWSKVYLNLTNPFL